MAPEELAEELALLRTAWDWVDPSVRYYVCRAGRDVCLVTRQYKRLYGQLGLVSFQPDEIRAIVTNREWHPVDGKMYDEMKEIVMGYGQLVSVETTLESEEALSDLGTGVLSDNILSEIVGQTIPTEEHLHANDPTGSI